MFNSEIHTLSSSVRKINHILRKVKNAVVNNPAASVIKSIKSSQEGDILIPTERDNDRITNT